MNYEIFLLFILLILSGFFSGVEAALMSVSDVKVRQLFERKRKGSKSLKELKSNPHHLIITLLVGNNLVNIAASAIATSIAIKLLGSYGVGAATGGMTFLVLVFGEIFPKGVAINNSEKISLRVAGFILFLMKILYPLIIVLDALTSRLISLVSGKRSEEPLVTEEELRDIVKIGATEGSINSHEKNMIDNIFELDNTTAGEIMTPRTDMFVLNANSRVADVIDVFLKEGYTRVPIYGKNHDNIIGMVHVSQIFNKVAKGKTATKLRTIKRPVKFIPEAKKVDELLREFQNAGSHIAIVVDEHGGVAGLITIEDLIEEIVGEIYDEDEQKEDLITKHGKNEFLLKGNAELDDIKTTIGVKLNHSENVNTLGGFIFEQIGKIPRRGEKIELDNAELEILRIIRHRIKLVRFKKK